MAGQHAPGRRRVSAQARQLSLARWCAYAARRLGIDLDRALDYSPARLRLLLEAQRVVEAEDSLRLSNVLVAALAAVWSDKGPLEDVQKDLQREIDREST